MPGMSAGASSMQTDTWSTAGARVLILQSGGQPGRRAGPCPWEVQALYLGPWLPDLPSDLQEPSNTPGRPRRESAPGTAQTCYSPPWPHALTGQQTGLSQPSGPFGPAPPVGPGPRPTPPRCCSSLTRPRPCSSPAPALPSHSRPQEPGGGLRWPQKVRSTGGWMGGPGGPGRTDGGQTVVTGGAGWRRVPSVWESILKRQVPPLPQRPLPQAPKHSPQAQPSVPSPSLHRGVNVL